MAITLKPEGYEPYDTTVSTSNGDIIGLDLQADAFQIIDINATVNNIEILPVLQFYDSSGNTARKSGYVRTWIDELHGIRASALTDSTSSVALMVTSGTSYKQAFRMVSSSTYYFNLQIKLWNCDYPSAFIHMQWVRNSGGIGHSRGSVRLLSNTNTSDTMSEIRMFGGSYDMENVTVFNHVIARIA